MNTARHRRFWPSLMPALGVLGLGLLAAPVGAQPQQAGFVGLYQQRSVDTVAQLTLFPDRQFCFAMIAGALDIYAPGRWEVLGRDSQGTRLKLTRTSNMPSRFVLSSHVPIATIAGQAAPKPELLINTAAFSMLQPDAVFGSSDRPETPANLAPMFAPGQHSFNRSERLPLQHRYLFLGHPAAEGGWHISRFDIGQPAHSVRLNISEEAIQAGAVWEARFHNGRLQLQNSDMGAPKALSKTMANDIRRGCLSSAPDNPRITLFRPQAEYHIHALPNQRPWFGVK